MATRIEGKTRTQLKRMSKRDRQDRFSLLASLAREPSSGRMDTDQLFDELVFLSDLIYGGEYGWQAEEKPKNRKKKRANKTGLAASLTLGVLSKAARDYRLFVNATSDGRWLVSAPNLPRAGNRDVGTLDVTNSGVDFEGFNMFFGGGGDDGEGTWKKKYLPNRAANAVMAIASALYAGYTFPNAVAEFGDGYLKAAPYQLRHYRGRASKYGDKIDGSWPRIIGGAKLQESEDGSALYAGPGPEQGVIIYRDEDVPGDPGPRPFTVFPFLRGVKSRIHSTGTFTKKEAIDYVRKHFPQPIGSKKARSTRPVPKKARSTRSAPKKAETGLAAKYTAYAADWKRRPRLVARFKKGKSPPRS